jgi:hypothetical protein
MHQVGWERVAAGKVIFRMSLKHKGYGAFQLADIVGVGKDRLADPDAFFERLGIKFEMVFGLCQCHWLDRRRARSDLLPRRNQELNEQESEDKVNHARHQ